MKTIKAGETFTDDNGDVWTAAIMVVDIAKVHALNGTIDFIAHVYKDAAARTARFQPLNYPIHVPQAAVFLHFDLTQPIDTIYAQCEDYALTLLLEDNVTFMFHQFE